MKKVIGFVNLFFGMVEILIGVPYILYTIPKLLKMYEDLGVNLPYTPSTAYLFPAFLILLGLVNVMAGFGNFHILFKNKSELIYKVGMFLVILSFILTGLFLSNMINSMINPIYSLSNTISN
jgi:hypothetical protein